MKRRAVLGITLLMIGIGLGLGCADRLAQMQKACQGRERNKRLRQVKAPAPRPFLRPPVPSPSVRNSFEAGYVNISDKVEFNGV